jgi:electron transport complex protein RnfG
MIQLLLGIDAAGTLTGVRVISHRETTGIGDAVDAAKSPWIRSFDGRSLRNVALTIDGGSIDAISGASVTSRAVVNGVRDALTDAAASPPQSCSNVVDE